MRTTVFLNPPTYSVTGEVRLEVSGGTALDTGARRVNRVKTLNGSATIVDMGFCEADRDLTLIANYVTETDLALLKLWLRTYETLLLSLPDGFYVVVPSSLDFSNGVLTLRLMVSSKVTE